MNPKITEMGVFLEKLSMEHYGLTQEEMDWLHYNISDETFHGIVNLTLPKDYLQSILSHKPPMNDSSPI